MLTCIFTSKIHGGLQVDKASLSSICALDSQLFVCGAGDGAVQLWDMRQNGRQVQCSAVHTIRALSAFVPCKPSRTAASYNVPGQLLQHDHQAALRSMQSFRLDPTQ